MARKDDKRITDAQQGGDAGHGWVHYVVTEKLGFLWHPSGKNEAGIDGTIELRDPDGGQVRAQVVVAQIRSTRGRWDDEDERGFTHTVPARDLRYWLESNAPFILILARPHAQEAWWASIHDVFADPDGRAKRRLYIDKQRNAFDEGAADGLRQVAQRARERLLLRVRMLLAGPYSAVGLQDQLDVAVGAEEAGQWVEAAERWNQLADDAEHRHIDRRLVWPARSRSAAALEQAGRRRQAGREYRRLGRERLDEDDPQASFDLGRASWYGAGDDDFEFSLLVERAEAPEQGIAALDGLRRLNAAARTAGERYASAAALVDQLTFYGFYREGFEVADGVLGKRIDTPEKRQLALVRLDCAAESGREVGDEWRALVTRWRDRGPVLYARALQRWATALTRAGDPESAKRQFQQAADVWGQVDGGEEQVAEAILSADTVSNMSGLLRDDLPVGARQAAALARGSLTTPAARSDRLANAGLAFLAERERPDALKRVTLAALVDRRAGNLFSWRRALHFLARAYEDTDEWAEALRFWIMAGAELRAAEVSPKIPADTVVPMLRLDVGPPWERAASFAALEPHVKELDPRTVRRLSATIVDAAEPLPEFVAPQPSFYARKVLAAGADRILKRDTGRARKVLAQDVELRAYNAAESAGGLIALHKRGVPGAIDVLVEAMLAGHDLPVTLAGWLHDAPDEVQKRIVDAAKSDNVVALGEAVRADLPEGYPELRALCEERVARLLSAPRDDADGSFGASFAEYGDLGRFCRRSLQRRLGGFLVDEVVDARSDEPSKATALVAVALLAPALTGGTARLLLERLLPVAAGEPLKSAPPVLTDHRNPKRARSRFTRQVGDSRLRGAAIQACGRLAHVANPRSRPMARVLREAVDSGDTTLLRFALRELAGLPSIRIPGDLDALTAHDDAGVRTVAKELQSVWSDDGD
jgi:hypothetical protein